MKYEALPSPLQTPPDTPEIILLTAHRAMAMLPLIAEQIRAHVACSQIRAIAPSALRHEIEALGLIFTDEDTVVPGLSYDGLRTLITSRNANAAERTGWYLQQFLKMGYARVTDDTHYLIWDSDTMPLKDISMFDENGTPFFDIKEEYHPPYFDTMARLFDGKVKKTGDFSYISEHMLIVTDLMRSLLDAVEDNTALPGTSFYEKIIAAVDPAELTASGFSEFETYGCFVDTYHPGTYVRRSLRSFRRGDELMKDTVEERLKQYVFQTYDLITFENRG